VQDLLARMVKVEAKAEKVDGKWTIMEIPMQQAQGTSTLVQDLLARMVIVEAKAEERGEKRTDLEARTKILELEVEKLKDELESEREAGQSKEAEIQELT
jgi:hypothetical protein